MKREEVRKKREKNNKLQKLAQERPKYAQFTARKYSPYY